jgi:Outer membrane protein beta-barrel domain
MPMTRTVVMAMLVAAAAANANAQTQPPPASLGFVNVSFGSQPVSRDASTNQSFPLYGETATFTTVQENGSGAVFDITGGYRIRPSFGVAIGFSNFSNTTDASLASSIPNPLIFDQPLAATATVSDLEHSERGIHLQAVWFLPVSDKIDVALSVGPSFIMVSQDLVTSLDVPAGTQTGNPVVTTEKETGIGINVGFDGAYMVTRNFGAGIFLRYAGAKVDLPTVADLSVGGFQVGAGVRVRF